MLGESELGARKLSVVGVCRGGAASARDQDCWERARTRDLKLGLGTGLVSSFLNLLAHCTRREDTRYGSKFNVQIELMDLNPLYLLLLCLGRCHPAHNGAAN